MILFLNDARGIYIPRDFAQCVVRDQVVGVSQEDWDTLEAGPDHELYWDVWTHVCDNAVITDPTNGKHFTLLQSGDLWLVEDGEEIPEDF